MKTALWWMRRDLRLSDNQALSAALSQAGQVLPVFVRDPTLLNSPLAGEKRLAFLYDGLRALDNDLHERGSYLVLRSGDPVHVLRELINEVEAEAIFAEADHSPYARRRDEEVARALSLHSYPGVTVHSPEAVVKADGTPYTVFTPFSKAWLKRPWPGRPLPAPGWIGTPSGVRSEGIPASPRLPGETYFQAGESEAQRRLAAFTEEAISRYGDERNRMDLAGTSRLSPYLRFGMLSARQAAEAARRAEASAAGGVSRRSAEAWLNELIWREFYIAIFYHFPHVRRTAFRPALRDIPWTNDPEDYAAWLQGRTGYPVVDAAMRQLLQTGWMHNRARMISASFLSKDLLVDWRWGERHFMQHLIDGDPAANNGGWQWTVGTGTDAAPYYRIFNPVTQSMKFDPHGSFIRRFVPELANVPNQFIHNPWMMPPDMQKRLGCLIGKDYPAPIVDHRLARDRIMALYKARHGSIHRRGDAGLVSKEGTHS
jgi:deoxyribodipyrimidine photo-lyase